MSFPQRQVTAQSLESDAAILDSHPAPVLITDAAGNILSHNAPAAALFAALGGIVDAAAQFGRLGQAALDQSHATTMRFAFGEGEDRRSYEAMAMPASGGRALVICRDATADENIRLALTESRRRFQDLVNIASDFAWETTAAGRLAFVSPAGALGYTAQQLVGTDPAALSAEPDRRSDSLPFSARKPIREEQLWFRAAGGAAVCMLVSATPVPGPPGSWRGARGVCRDITEQIRRDEQLQSALVREQLTAHIVDQIRTEADPSAMLDAAATALAHAVSATALVCRVSPAGRVNIVAQAGAALSLEAIGDILTELAVAATDGAQREITDPRAGDLRLLARKTVYHRRTNGLVILLRQAGAGPDWSGDDHALLDAVARQLGIALRQVADTAELERLSHTDELTGLSNRRAFMAELETSLQRANREGRAGALLYIDLDNFKPVNDRFGHDRGDAILRAVAAVLRDHARGYDLVARLGGDEFVMWLEGVAAAQAGERRDQLVGAVASAGRNLLPPDCQIGASVGIVNLLETASATVDDLLTRADQAMYQTKSERKAKRPAPAQESRS